MLTVNEKGLQVFAFPSLIIENQMPPNFVYRLIELLNKDSKLMKNGKPGTAVLRAVKTKALLSTHRTN